MTGEPRDDLHAWATDQIERYAAKHQRYRRNAEALSRMLELNRAADVALLYEVPEVGPDLFSRVRE